MQRAWAEREQVRSPGAVALVLVDARARWRPSIAAGTWSGLDRTVAPQVPRSRTAARPPRGMFGDADHDRAAPSVAAAVSAQPLNVIFVARGTTSLSGTRSCIEAGAWCKRIDAGRRPLQ